MSSLASLDVTGGTPVQAKRITVTVGFLLILKLYTYLCIYKKKKTFCGFLKLDDDNKHKILMSEKGEW